MDTEARADLWEVLHAMGARPESQPCDMAGVTCEREALGRRVWTLRWRAVSREFRQGEACHVVMLNLSDLQGVLPEALGRLHALRSIRLSNCHFAGAWKWGTPGFLTSEQANTGRIDNPDSYGCFAQN